MDHFNAALSSFEPIPCLCFKILYEKHFFFGFSFQEVTWILLTSLIFPEQATKGCVAQTAPSLDAASVN